MNRTSLARRFLAGAASVMIGGAAALTFAAPAQATQDGDVQPLWGKPVENNVTATGAAECDVENETWTVTWTVTNASSIQATVTALSSEVDGIALNDLIPAGESVSGTQSFPGGTESATLDVELKWAWQEKKWKWTPRGPRWEWVWKVEHKTASPEVELGDCAPEDPPPPPPPPVDDEPPAAPNLITLASCDLLGFIIDNSVGEGEAVVTLTPNGPVTHGHASGFSYSIEEAEGEGDETETSVEVTAEEGAGISEVVAEDSDAAVELGPFPAGADPHTHAFEALEGLVVTVELTVDGEVVEDHSADVSWDEAVAEGGLECGEEEEEPEGEGGELPTTGASTGLIAGGAVLLLAIGGGLYLVARRRRVTFSA